MINMKIRCPAWPLLSGETVDTSKVELIPQPLAKAVAVAVPTWSVLPTMGMHCVLEYSHWFSLLLARRLLPPKRIPDPSKLIKAAGDIIAHVRSDLQL